MLSIGILVKLPRQIQYSINHLYGNAGGRKNYSAHSCSSIAERSSSVNEELTCPFTTVDIEDAGCSSKCVEIDHRKKCFDHLRKGKVDIIKTDTFIVTRPSKYVLLSRSMGHIV